MADITENRMFVYFTLFYSILIALIIIAPFDVSYTENHNDDLDDVSIFSDILDTIDSFFIDLTGLPSIINKILFSPAVIIALYLIIRLIVWVTPFTG
ncbi:MAG: hypothetical protein ABEK36_05275 [Candidatus Aenigmatarchaeota archaeon]